MTGKKCICAKRTGKNITVYDVQTVFGPRVLCINCKPTPSPWNIVVQYSVPLNNKSTLVDTRYYKITLTPNQARCAQVSWKDIRERQFRENKCKLLQRQQNWQERLAYINRNPMHPFRKSIILKWFLFCLHASKFVNDSINKHFSKLFPSLYWEVKNNRLDLVPSMPLDMRRLLKERSQLAIDTAFVKRICSAKLNLGKDITKLHNERNKFQRCRW